MKFELLLPQMLCELPGIKTAWLRVITTVRAKSLLMKIMMRKR